MNCEETQSRLVEAVEGELGGQLEARLKQHLDACDGCRTEFEQLRRGAGVLRDVLPMLAPRQTYLSRARIERLMDAHRRRRTKVFRLIPRALVGVAAAAAIVISAVFIRAQLLGLPGPASQPPALAQVPAMRPGPPVVLAAAGQDEPGGMMRRIPVIEDAWTASQEPPPADLRPVQIDSPGAVVPVHHAFYDPEESIRWW